MHHSEIPPAENIHPPDGTVKQMWLLYSSLQQTLTGDQGSDLLINTAGYG